MGLPSAPTTLLSDHQLLIRSILANVGAAAAWIVIILLVLGNIFASLPEAPWFWRSAGAAFATSFILWLAMWIEYFRERPPSNNLLWIWLLMTGPVMGPLLFYHRIWRKRLGSMTRVPVGPNLS
jgi:hypothetical protein